MGQFRHVCATTTHAVPAAIRRSQASLATLSRELGINPETVAKWRKRATVEDLKTGPKALHSTTLSEPEETMVVAFRKQVSSDLALEDYVASGAFDPFVRRDPSARNDLDRALWAMLDEGDTAGLLAGSVRGR